MEKLFNPATFVTCERYKFWSNGKRKPSEPVQELAARTNFIGSNQNEAVLKALFRIPEQELTFAKAVEVFNEIEGAAMVAKDAVYHLTSEAIHSVQFKSEQMAHVKRGEKTQLQGKFNSNKTSKWGNANATDHSKNFAGLPGLVFVP